MKYIYTFLLVSSIVWRGYGQTFTGTGGTITDGNWTHDQFPLTVNGLPAVINNGFGLESVRINIVHPYDGDLEVMLVAPDGSATVLVSFFGGTGDNFTNTVFNGSVLNPEITSAQAPFTGIYQPFGYLSTFNNSQNPNGTWTLLILDGTGGDAGYLVDWDLTFGLNPATQSVFSSSNLPIISINTNNQPITDEPKISANMGIISNAAGQRNHLTDPFNNYHNKIGIELRGNYSQTYPQVCYGFETRDIQDSILDTMLLGMPKEHEWVLYAPYNDRSMLRNVLTYKLSNEMGNYASRTQFCELLINGQYQGIYVLMEKIKRDDNRVKIKKMDGDDNFGDSLTGGYIFKIDWWAGNGNNGWASAYNNIIFQYHYPKYPTLPQSFYLKQFVDSFETALYGNNFTDPVVGYKKYINVTSFIDYMFLQELSKNPDGYRASTYFSKEKITDGGKIKAGPQWDINYGYGNFTGCESQLAAKWEFETYSCDQKVRWWNRLMTDTVFQNNVKCRWTWLRTKTLSTDYMLNYIDSMHNYLDEAQDRHFEKWNLLGIGVVGSPDAAPATFQGEIDVLKKWIVDRIAWLDTNMPGKCYNVSVEDQEENTRALVQTWPNPFNDHLDVNYFLNVQSVVKIQLVDMMGRVVESADQGVKSSGDYNTRMEGFGALPAGIYSLVVSIGDRTHVTKVVKE